MVGAASGRKRQVAREDLPLSASADRNLTSIAQSLAQQIDEETFRRKYAPAAAVLKLVGAGVFLAASIAVPNLPRAVKPFLSKSDEHEVWKRFNIPYLKRTLQRLKRQKLVSIREQKGKQVVEITERGKRKLLHCSFDALMTQKPKTWDSMWRIVSYDIPTDLHRYRTIFREYLRAWRFYPLHESVFLHAYPCEAEIEWLRTYLGIESYVRIFTVLKIENDTSFREFFGVA